MRAGCGQNRFALAGDAAVGMHPVTAHGFNLGLASVERLAAIARDAIQRKGTSGARKGWRATSAAIVAARGRCLLATRAIVNSTPMIVRRHACCARVCCVRVGD